MAALLGIDIAWDRPTVQQILATGANWVARYLSPDASKNLTAAEVHDYPASGLSVVTVFESSAGRATQGRAAGVADAQLAEQQRRTVGLPDSHIHHFAVDLDTTWAAVKPYFDGAASVIGLARTGCYGGLHVIEGAHAYGIDYLWQTVAWSGGLWSPFATISQPGGTLMAGAADIDYAEVPDFGQFPRPVSPEVDVPLTQDDANLVVNTLMTWGVPELTLPDGKGGYLKNAFIQLPERAAQRQAQTAAAVQALAAQVTALAAKVATPAPVVLSDAQVAAMAAALAPAVADLLAQRLAN